jgi:hypothetical protein
MVTKLETMTEQWNKHRRQVDKLAKELGRVALTKAPFIIVDNNVNSIK